MSAERLPADRVRRLLDRLRSPDQAKRVHAALRLTGADVEGGLVQGPLQVALADPDPQVRRLAEWVLGQRGAGSPAA